MIQFCHSPSRKGGRICRTALPFPHFLAARNCALVRHAFGGAEMVLLRFSRLHARTAAEILIAAVVAYAVARHCIAASFQIGRLSMPADFDDVVYLGSAQLWLNELSRHGFLGDLAGLINQHAPVQTAIAALSYLLAGP